MLSSVALYGSELYAVGTCSALIVSGVVERSAWSVWSMERFACYTFAGAGRVWRTFSDAKRYSRGKRVRRFPNKQDAIVWLYSVQYL